MSGVGASVSTKLSSDEFLDWPEGDQNRYELIEGEVTLTPAPNIEHQFIVLRIARHLDEFLERHPVGRAFVSPVDVRLDDANVVQPDVFVVLADRAGRIVKETHVEGAPDLVIEVLSKRTRSRDRTLKLGTYARSRVPEVWLVDSGPREVQVLRLDESGAYAVPERVEETGALTTPLLPGFSLPVSRIFP